MLMRDAGDGRQRGQFIDEDAAFALAQYDFFATSSSSVGPSSFSSSSVDGYLPYYHDLT